MDLPFLYQTRTILRLASAGATRVGTLPIPTQIRKVSSVDSSSSPSVSPPQLRPQQPPPSPQNKDAVDPKTKFFQLQAERRAAAAAGQPEPQLPKPAVKSTITPQERRAFARLHEIALRQQAGLPPEEVGRLNVQPEIILSLFPGPPTQRRPESQQESQDEERHDSWARQGHQQLETVATRQPRPKSKPTEDVVSPFCSEQMRNYYRSLNEALHSTTVHRDVAVLNVLQNQVFPLLELITPPLSSSSSSSSLGKDTEPTKSSKKTSKTKAKKTSKTAGGNSSSSVNEAILTLTSTAKPTLSPLAIVSRLYPAATLLALRLLTKHQPLSPISSSFLSTIRDLGPTSYVLAANTHFYNTFLFLRWNVSSSLSEICGLLSEMERAAVEFDKGTVEFLADVAEDRARDLYTSSSRSASTPHDGDGTVVGEHRGGAQWWHKQEQQKWWPRIQEWRRIIARRILLANGGDDGDLSTVERHRPYSKLLDQRLEDGPSAHDGSRQVWL